MKALLDANLLMVHREAAVATVAENIPLIASDAALRKYSIELLW